MENSNNKINRASNKNIDRLLGQQSSNVQGHIYPVNIQPDSARYSLYELKRLIEEYKEIDMNPEFQRKLVWKPQQQSELIESILMGIPLPLFYFAITKDGKYAVVDGLQRLSTVINYMNNKFKITKSKYIDHIMNKTFKSLNRSDQAKIEKYQIQAYIIPSTVPDRVKLDIFDRINRGGTKINSQEMRHALYPGQCTKLLSDLSESIIFKNAINNRLNALRMRDKYVILRFISLYLWRNIDSFNLHNDSTANMVSDFDEFLANYMQIINRMNNIYLTRLSDLFLNIMNIAVLLFDGNCFTKKHVNNMPFNINQFETLSYLLSSIDFNKSIDIPQLRNTIIDIENELFQTKSMSNPSSIKAFTEQFNQLEKYMPL